MCVDAARQDELAVGADYLGRPTFETPFQNGDFAILDPDIAPDSVGRGQHGAAADRHIQQFRTGWFCLHDVDSPFGHLICPI